MSQNQILELLAKSPMTALELATFLGYGDNTVRKQIRNLRHRLYVCAWEKPNDRTEVQYSRVWAVGDRPDAKKPAKVLPITVKRNYDARMKAQRAAQRKASHGIWGGLM